ncbi:hypothetical protein ScPMuIL_008863 [Solemya velum]
MGQTTSSVARKLTKSVSSMFTASSTDKGGGLNGKYQMEVTPFVFTRTGSMFFDEDGDLAHEFYEEVTDNHGCHMTRLYQNLIPQGEVSFPHPRLNADFPVVICEAPLR